MASIKFELFSFIWQCVLETGIEIEQKSGARGINLVLIESFLKKINSVSTDSWICFHTKSPLGVPQGSVLMKVFFVVSVMLVYKKLRALRTMCYIYNENVYLFNDTDYFSPTDLLQNAGWVLNQI